MFRIVHLSFVNGMNLYRVLNEYGLKVAFFGSKEEAETFVASMTK
jgi:hypothetical protein